MALCSPNHVTSQVDNIIAFYQLNIKSREILVHLVARVLIIQIPHFLKEGFTSSLDIERIGQQGLD